MAKLLHEPMGQNAYAVKSVALFSQSSLSELLSCIRNTCNTISENQLEILWLFKDNLRAIKTEVDSCLNQLIGRELELRHILNSGNSISIETPAFENNTVIETPAAENKIVIHGLKSLQDVESREQAVVSVNLLFEKVLKVYVKATTVEVINRTTHVVAIVSLSSATDRRKIFGNCHRLKSFCEKISITDYVPSSKRKRKKLPIKSHDPDCFVTGKDVKGDCENRNSSRNTPTNTKTDQTNFVAEGSIEENFWNSIDVHRKTHEILKLGKDYGLEEKDIHRLSDLIRAVNQKRLEISVCVCETYTDLEWKRISETFGNAIPRKFVKKLKLVIKSLVNMWNSEQRWLSEKCYCQHISSYADEAKAAAIRTAD